MKVKKQHLQIAVVVLVVALMVGAVNFFRPSTKPMQLPQAAGDQRGPISRDMPGPARSTVRSIDPATIPPPPSVDRGTVSAATRDPFLFGSETREVFEAPIIYAVGAEPAVRMILYSPARRIALIENKMVHVGDQVGDFRVVQIERNAVTFTTPTGERRRVSTMGVVQSPGAYK